MQTVKHWKDCFNIRKQNIYLRTAVFQGRRKVLSISKKFLKYKLSICRVFHENVREGAIHEEQK